MAVQIQLRRSTAAQWTAADPTLAQGELGIETDTNLGKLGDGATPWTALAYWPTGASGGAIHFDPLFQEKASLSSKTIASFPAAFESYWVSRRHGSWDALYKYLWWSFYNPGNDTWLAPAQYASYADIATALMTIVPNNGTNWDNATFVDVYTYDAVDHQDSYPKERHCRNSILASMKGSGRHLVRSQDERSGVNSLFNTAYFTSLQTRPVNNTLGIELVRKYTNDAQIPGTNDNGAVWYSGGKRGGLWNFPKVGEAVEINAGTRKAVWNGTNWVTPAPGGSYIIQPPFFLHEPNRAKALLLDYMSDAEAITYPTKGVAVAIHPVVDGNNVAFLATAAGFDSWWTEALPVEYEHTARVIYRHESGDRVVVIPRAGGTVEKSMYTHFVPGAGARNSYFFKDEGQRMSLDSDTTIPTKVQVARRHTTTGVRSPWVTLGVVKRRLKNIPLRFDPAYRK